MEDNTTKAEVDDMVHVKVLEVDVERKRISLSMKSTTDNEIIAVRPERTNQKIAHKPKPAPVQQNSMANAFAKALKK